MRLKKDYLPILWANILLIVIFTYLYLARKNYEFLLYLGVMVFFALLVFFTIQKVNYPVLTLWGLTLWGALHLSGGYFFISIRHIQIWPICSPCRLYSRNIADVWPSSAIIKTAVEKQSFFRYCHSHGRAWCRGFQWDCRIHCNGISPRDRRWRLLKHFFGPCCRFFRCNDCMVCGNIEKSQITGF